MKINLTEMMRLKGRLADINSEMESIFSSVNAELESVSSNINSSALHQSIVNVQDNIKTLSTSLTNDMNNLEVFMEQQLSSYTVTNEEASSSLAELVNLVQQTFDENGNIIATVSASAATMSSMSGGRMADPNIGDQSSYDAGANALDTFTRKIGNSDEKWAIVDETYYFFKEKGLSDEQIAGIIGNMTQESALDLRCPTGQYEGLFQWSNSRKPESFDLNTQLEHAWQEIQTDRYSGKVLSNLSEQTTVGDATYSFAYWFEGYTGEMTQRKDFANGVYYYIKNNL